MRIAFLCLVAAANALAQSPTPEPARARLVFPARPGEPVETPARQATVAPQPLPQDWTPDSLAQAFFGHLKKGEVDAGLDALARDSMIADRKDEVSQLKERIKGALEEFGEIRDFELISERAAGSSLVRRTYVSLGKDLPLRWSLYFYKTSRGWRLADFRVDDNLVELIELQGSQPGGSR